MSGSLIKQGHTQPSCYLKPPVVISKKRKMCYVRLSTAQLPHLLFHALLAFTP